MTSPKPSLSDFATYRLHRIVKQFDRGIARAYTDELGLSLSEARTLAAIGEFGPFLVIDLARFANLDKSQASRAADHLIKQGLVKREPSPTDGRAVLISLSATGKPLYEKIMRVASGRHETLMSALTTQERAVMERALGKLLAQVETML
ncbi:MarR family winged helix-turn-helix transcriptional regulator [Cupriavidus basilensis]|uniref:MarR family winged helix-turn-helix transcriptional regulator n=1 Tax=Cupriavidus TaxID=106589 RepID=UPI00044A0575|nr:MULTISPECIES: MarR family transcriptional regulator [Cupriavidus]KDP84264.1 MarR family transcriptional regulator [Cupriavidus sp. SK-3]MDF3885740.1 MarR family transcriptional regulator [Cupriavidus basilensis]